MEYIPDDLYSVVTRIVEDRLRFFRRYIGKVKLADSDGTMWVHSIDYGTEEDVPDTWVPCRPGHVFLDDKKPSEGDYIQFGFEDGTQDTPRYYAYSEQYLTLSSGSEQFIYTNTAIISHDPQTKILKIENGDQTITLDTNTGEMVLSNGNSEIILGSSKITINSSNIELNGISWDTHGHQYLGGGLGDTARQSGGPQ